MKSTTYHNPRVHVIARKSVIFVAIHYLYGDFSPTGKPLPSLSVTNVTSLPLNGYSGRELSFRKVCTSPYKGRKCAIPVVPTTSCFKTTFHFQLKEADQMSMCRSIMYIMLVGPLRGGACSFFTIL